MPECADGPPENDSGGPQKSRRKKWSKPLTFSFPLIGKRGKRRELILDRRKIVDFGLARHAGGPGGVTQEGVLTGTPESIRPEQRK
jgi:hypothetical protein